MKDIFSSKLFIVHQEQRRCASVTLVGSVQFRTVSPDEALTLPAETVPFLGYY